MLYHLLVCLLVGVGYAQGNCGISSYANARVVGGVTARPGAWPWQVALNYNGNFHCGGSLITPNWLVTAAHCVHGRSANRFRIVLGEHNRRYNERTEQFFTAARIVMHSGYNSRTVDNDIALIKLDRPARLTQRVKTVCLPRQGQHIQPGSTCYITGWGKASHPGSSQVLLQQSPLRVVSNNVCHYFNLNGMGKGIRPSMLCAGYGPSNPRSGCHGDSGGPFVCKSGNQWTLHGAVSWGSGRCSTRDAYTVFARVAGFTDWILRNLS